MEVLPAECAVGAGQTFQFRSKPLFTFVVADARGVLPKARGLHGDSFFAIEVRELSCQLQVVSCDFVLHKCRTFHLLGLLVFGRSRSCWLIDGMGLQNADAQSSQSLLQVLVSWTKLISMWKHSLYMFQPGPRLVLLLPNAWQTVNFQVMYVHASEFDFGALVREHHTIIPLWSFDAFISFSVHISWTIDGYKFDDQLS